MLHRGNLLKQRFIGGRTGWHGLLQFLDDFRVQPDDRLFMVFGGGSAGAQIRVVPVKVQVALLQPGQFRAAQPGEDGGEINRLAFGGHGEQSADLFIRKGAALTPFPPAGFHFADNGQRIGRHAPRPVHPVEQSAHAVQKFVERLGSRGLLGAPGHERIGGCILGKLPAAFFEQSQAAMFDNVAIFFVAALGAQVAEVIVEMSGQRFCGGVTERPWRDDVRRFTLLLRHNFMQPLHRHLLVRGFERDRSYLVAGRDVSLLALDRFRLRDEIEQRIQEHRDRERNAAFQQFLLADSPLAVSAERAINFKMMSYEPSWLYEGGFQFKKHYFGPKPGELLETTPSGKLKEEFQCAQFLDGLPEVRFWARNLANKTTSFRLQTSKNWFYPDFLCQLNDSRVLVVEYKGEHLFTDAEEKRAVGAVWQSRSGGKCLFVMPTEGDFSVITQAIR